jgi:hypothetical protein
MMTRTLKKTAVISGMVGTALFMFLQTKKGQQIKNQLKDNLDDLYEDVGQKLQNLGDTTKEKYDEIVATLVDQYSQKKMLATGIAVDLTRELQKKWLAFQLYYLYNRIKSLLLQEDEANQTKFNKVTTEVIEEYGKDKQLTKEEIAKLNEEIKKKWKEFKAELAS